MLEETGRKLQCRRKVTVDYSLTTNIAGSRRMAGKPLCVSIREVFFFLAHPDGRPTLPESGLIYGLGSQTE